MYEKFEKLLEKQRVSAYQVAKATGLNQAMFSEWKKGSYSPKIDKLQKIADYFGVTVEYFLDEKYTESNSHKYYVNDETGIMAQKLFQNKDLKLLFDAAVDASPEDLKTVHAMLLALKAKEGK